MTPEGWRREPAERCITAQGRVGWKGLSKDEFTTEGPYLVTGMHFLPHGRVDWDACFRIPEWRYNESPEVMLRPEDVLLTKDGTIGKVALVDDLPGPAALNSHLYVVRSSDGSLAPRFIFYVLQSPQFRDFVGLNAAGSTIVGLPWKVFRKFEFPIPPAAEQRRIAAILSSVDDAIEASQAVIDQLQVVKKAMMADLLTRGLPGRHTRFKQTEIGEVPEGWLLQSVDQLGADGEPAVRSGPFGSSMKTKDFRASGVPVLTIQALGEGEIVPSGLFFVDEEKAAELEAYRVRDNDLVFSRVADIGRCAAITPREEGWLISPNLSRVRLDSRKADAAFVMYLLTLNEGVQRQIAMVAGNAGRPVISSTTLRALRLPVPPVQEQEAILLAGRRVENRISAEVRELEALRATKTALLSTLLTGELRVQRGGEGR